MRKFTVGGVSLAVAAALLLSLSQSKAEPALQESDKLIAWFCLGSGPQPEKGYLYSMAGTKPVQKVPEGYLVKPASCSPYDNVRPVLVYTEPGQEIHGTFPKAYYIGEKEYQTIQGFTRKTYAFKTVQNDR
jgi:hypothetical protein